MSFVARLLQPAPASRRAYSSFFSSKSGGGGRYFNSAKPPKPAVTAGKGKVENTNSSVAASESANGGGNGSNNKIKVGGAEENSSAQAPPAPNPIDAASPSSRLGSGNPSPVPSSPAFSAQHSLPIHPTIASQDYKLHQFFSLHRPLLLLAQPTSAIFESPPFPPSAFTFNAEAKENIEKAPSPPLQFRTLDDPPEASFESDADTARQLAHTLVMNRVGGTISWQDALSRLGLDKDVPVERAALAKEWAKEWETVYADSTKRKRRRKMKKHKLKKRRRFAISAAPGLIVVTLGCVRISL
ncbi:hypothetical protein SERLA73DRAFT_186581, partial [Serpula lacrymans var. lacrymans S7.3]